MEIVQRALSSSQRSAVTRTQTPELEPRYQRTTAEPSSLWTRSRPSPPAQVFSGLGIAAPPCTLLHHDEDFLRRGLPYHRKRSAAGRTRQAVDPLRRYADLLHGIQAMRPRTIPTTPVPPLVDDVDTEEARTAARAKTVQVVRWLISASKQPWRSLHCVNRQIHPTIRGGRHPSHTVLLRQSNLRPSECLGRLRYGA